MSVRLYLIRHGQALDLMQDPQRHLTEKGKSDAYKLAEFLKKADVKIDSILSSKKSRAFQTAEIIHSVLAPQSQVEKVDGIAPNDSVESFLEHLDLKEKNIIIVGHLPFLANLVSLILTQDQRSLSILYPTCSVICLEQKGRGSWQLAFAVNPEML